jgi:glycosyltransferase involved in cell wall biosynthesis
VIDRLARGFVAAGHEVLLYTTGDSTCPVPRAWVREAAAPEQIGQSYVEMHHLLHAYDEVGAYDVVHDHTVVGPIYAKGRTRGPIVTTNHGPFSGEMNEIYSRMAEHAAVVAISHDQASRSSVPISAVIHHGLDPDEFPVGDGEGDHVVFLGRFSPDKGAREAVLAATQAGVPLVLAAKMREPLEVDYFEAEVKPLLSDTVQYVGEVGAQRKRELLGSARALLNPIQWPEPFGLVMIEALASGTPVVTTRWGAAPEIVDDGVTGFLCDSVDELADALGRLDEIDRTACRKVVEGHFSTERMVREHLDLYERLFST